MVVNNKMSIYRKNKKLLLYQAYKERNENLYIWEMFCHFTSLQASAYIQVILNIFFLYNIKPV